MNKNLKKIVITLVMVVTLLSTYATTSFAEEMKSGIDSVSTLTIDPPSEP